MHQVLKIIGIAIIGVLIANGVMMAFFPGRLYLIPSWLRVFGVFNTSYGSRGGANQYSVPQWQVRLKGAIYLIAVLLILRGIFRS